MRNTLGDDFTTAAIVVGYELTLDDFEAETEEIAKLAESLEAALKEHGLELDLFVPGDTTDDTGVTV